MCGSGHVGVGSDADIVIWDPSLTRTISAKTHHHAVDFNIFEGMEVRGNAWVTISQGEVVWEGNQLTDAVKQGRGQYISRTNFGSVFDGVTVRDEQRDEKRRKVEREPYTGPVRQV